MGLPFPFVTAYERMVRDVSRHELPAGACWNLVDIFPDFDAPARGRAPWAQYVDLGVVDYPMSVGWGNFGGSPSSLTVLESGTCIKATDAGAVVGVGTVSSLDDFDTVSRMVSLGEKLFFAVNRPGSPSNAGLYFFDGTNPVSKVTGGPSNPVDVCVYEDFVVAAQGDKVYFSNPADGTKWNAAAASVVEKQATTSTCTLTVANGFSVGDSITVSLGDPRFDGTFTISAVTSSSVSYLNAGTVVAQVVTTGTITDNSPDSFIQIQDDVVALAALRNVIIVFCEGSIWRIRGSVPPGNGPSNMIVDNLAAGMQGVISPKSIAYYSSTCLFANDQGVWQTDGVSLKNLSEKFGMQQYWRNIIEGEGVVETIAWEHRGYYFISLYSSIVASEAAIDTLVCDLDRGAFFRMSNMSFRHACDAVINGRDDTLFAYHTNVTTSNLGTISGIFDVDNVEASEDPNGVAIMPTIETAYLRGFLRLHRKWIPSPGLQTWRNAYLSYELAGGGNLLMDYTLSPEVDSDGSTTYSTLPNWGLSSLGGTDGRTRVRIPLEFTTQGIALRLRVEPGSNDWTSFRLWEVEVEFYPRETSRL